MKLGVASALILAMACSPALADEKSLGETVGLAESGPFVSLRATSTMSSAIFADRQEPTCSRPAVALACTAHPKGLPLRLVAPPSATTEFAGTPTDALPPNALAAVD